MKTFKRKALTPQSSNRKKRKGGELWQATGEYARALGYKVEIRLVPDTGISQRSSARAKHVARRST